MEIAWGSGFDRDATSVSQAAENCLDAGANLGSHSSGRIPRVAFLGSHLGASFQMPRM